MIWVWGAEALLSKDVDLQGTWSGAGMLCFFSGHGGLYQ